MDIMRPDASAPIHFLTQSRKGAKGNEGFSLLLCGFALEITGFEAGWQRSGSQIPQVDHAI